MVKQKIRNTLTTRFRSYITINRNLSSSNIYTDNGLIEKERIAATRFRLSSHNLKNEKGRWSRIPRERLLCECGGGIRHEIHVLTVCRKTRDILEHHNISLEDCGNDVLNFF